MNEEEEDAGIPEWVVTFGDMMSLLLTFFIMLVSMSEIKEEERFQALVASMRQQFGHDASMSYVVPGQQAPKNSNMNYIASQGRAMRRDTVRGGDKVQAPVGENPLVRDIRQGQNSTVGTVVYFAESSFELDEASKLQLQQAVDQIAGKPQRLEIRGHTSRRPLPQDSPLRDPWDLAYERCRVVSDFLVQQGIDPKRIRMGVAATNEPLYEGTDVARMARNARVQVLMWDERVDVTEPTTKP